MAGTKDCQASSAFSKASKSQESAEASSSVATASTITIEEPDFTESPDPFVTPEATPIAVPIPEPVTSFETLEELQSKCLGPKTNTCVLALVHDIQDADTITALASLASISQKHTRRGDHLFPFYTVPTTNPAFAAIQKALNMDSSTQLHLVAINSKRNWWRQHDSSKGWNVVAIESWIDGIRLGDSKKNKLPEDILSESTSSGSDVPSAPDATSSAASESSSLAHGEL